MDIPARFLAYSKETVLELRRTILSRRARERDQFSQKEVAGAIEWRPQEFSTWLNADDEDWDRLSEERYYRLLREVSARNWIVPDNYDHLFAAVSNFLGNPPTLTAEQYRHVEGHYVLYRYSLLAREQILQCALTISYNEQKKALQTREESRIPISILLGDTPQSPEAVVDELEMRDEEFPREGHFFRRSDHGYLLVSKKVNTYPAEIQMIYFNLMHGGGGDDKPPNHMWGYFCDWHSRRFYVGKVFAHRLTKELSPTQITARDPSVIAPNIVHGLLSGIPDKKLGVFEFDAPRD